MITATFFKDKTEQIVGFSLVGHAGYDDYGKDIVCASVSVLAINTVNSIEAFTEDKITANMSDSGLLTMRFDSKVSEKSKLLIDSFILGLQGICDEYSDEKYLDIIFKEV